jgi:AP2 domain
MPTMKGVTFNQQKQKWKAYTCLPQALRKKHGQQTLHIGYFTVQQEAGHAADV